MLISGADVLLPNVDMRRGVAQRNYRSIPCGTSLSAGLSLVDGQCGVVFCEVDGPEWSDRHASDLRAAQIGGIRIRRSENGTIRNEKGHNGQCNGARQELKRRPRIRDARLHDPRENHHHEKRLLHDFGSLIHPAGDFWDSTQFPLVAAQYPFRGPGVYILKGYVEEEFGHLGHTARGEAAVEADPRYGE